MFPAHAGMNQGRYPAALVQRRVPRACGDEPLIEFCLSKGRYVFPAHAGMNRAVSFGLRLERSVPRACGDEPLVSVLFRGTIMCSPRMRG